MTREEAAKIYWKNIGAGSVPGWVSDTINAFAELGMLKLDEPKSPEMRAGAIIAAYLPGIETAAVLTELYKAGLKIVAN